MTQIDFYTHVEDKLHTACALSAKAAASGVRLLILTPDAAVTEKLDRLLWSHPPTAFIPHCRIADPLCSATPVIVDHATDALPHDEVLLNLCAETPPFFSRFRRLLEIVSGDEEDRRLARERFRFYRDRGYEIRSHAMGKKTGKTADG